MDLSLHLAEWPQTEKGDVMRKSKRDRLVSLAAQMVRLKGMPDEFGQDLDLPKGTSIRVRRAIWQSAQTAIDQAHHWGVEIANMLNEGKEMV